MNVVVLEDQYSLGGTLRSWRHIKEYEGWQLSWRKTEVLEEHYGPAGMLWSWRLIMVLKELCGP